MSFTYSAIGSNTPENREHLERLGYKKHFLDREFDPLLHTWVGKESINTPGYSSLPIDSVWNPDNPEYDSNEIDCRNNDQLFQAVTAMREDSDIDQYFVADANIMYHLAFPDGEPFFGEIEKGEFFLMDKAMIHADMMGEERFIQDLSHKATIAELHKAKEK